MIEMGTNEKISITMFGVDTDLYKKEIEFYLIKKFLLVATESLKQFMT